MKRNNQYLGKLKTLWPYFFKKSIDKLTRKMNIDNDLTNDWEIRRNHLGKKESPSKFDTIRKRHQE